MHIRHASLSIPAVLFFVACGSPQRQPKQYTIAQFMNTVRIGGSSFSADEKQILFHSNQTGIFNAYTIPVTGGSGAN